MSFIITNINSRKSVASIKKDLINLRNKNPDKKIVLCSGSFDLTHAGHVLFFEDCKKLGDILVVDLGSDKSIKISKGLNRPILNEHIRHKTVSSLKTVDYCFVDRTKNAHKPESLHYYFNILKPNFYIQNSDAKRLKEGQVIAKQDNVKMVILARTCPKEFDSISTTKILDKIKKS